MPIVPLGFYIILSFVNVFPNVDGMSRLTFVSVGVSVWLLMAGLISVPMNNLEKSLKGLEGNRLSVLSHLFVGLADLAFDTFLRVVFVILILTFFSPDVINFNPLAFVVLGLACLCCFGVGVLLGILNLMLGDVSRMVMIFLQYGIFVSGVIFPVSRLGRAGEIMAVNPLHLIVDSIRSLVVLGDYQAQGGFIVQIVLGLVMLVWACSTLFILKDELRGRL